MWASLKRLWVLATCGHNGHCRCINIDPKREPRHILQVCLRCGAVIDIYILK